MTTTTVTSHYLPAEAMALAGNIANQHPIATAIGVLALYVGVMAYLKRRFGRGGGDIFVAALFFTDIVIFIAAGLYTFFTRPGYRVYHPLF